MEHANLDPDDVRKGIGDLAFAQPASEELGLLQTISDFPGIVQRAATEHRPLHLTNYVYELARRFNDFYHACPVLNSEEPVRSTRLALVAAARVTLNNGLDLLGIAAPEHM
jgi:arginyl-tRNA synthetase